jgi:hypothetical protein
MKTVKIQNNDYIEVNERLKHFRKNYNDHSLTTEVLEKTENSIMILATIKNKDGFILATGLAEEIKGSSKVNKTSHVENCETSAWGRALANFGIGIDTSVASANEVRNAKEQQECKKWLTESQFQATLKGSKKEAENVINLFRMKKEYKEQIINKFKIK